MFERLLLVRRARGARPHPAAACGGRRAPAPRPRSRAAESVLAGTGYKVDLGRAAGAGAQPGRAARADDGDRDWLARVRPAGDSRLPDDPADFGRAITTFRFTGRLSDRPEDRAAVPPGQRESSPPTTAAHRPSTCRRDGRAARAAELSVLVHETRASPAAPRRHALRVPQASETWPTQAQEKWLALFGRSLESEFEIDPFTRLVSTRCMQ